MIDFNNNTWKNPKVRINAKRVMDIEFWMKMVLSGIAPIFEFIIKCKKNRLAIRIKMISEYILVR